jgi:hypothetical protein
MSTVAVHHCFITKQADNGVVDEKIGDGVLVTGHFAFEHSRSYSWDSHLTLFAVVDISA